MRVDRDSGYRYYSATQLPRLNRILVLKEPGFALDQIAGLIEAGISANGRQGMVRLRRVEQQSKIVEENSRMAAIEHMIQEISREGAPLEVVLKETTPRWIVSVRDTVQSYPDIASSTRRFTRNWAQKR